MWIRVMIRESVSSCNRSWWRDAIMDPDQAWSERTNDASWHRNRDTRRIQFRRSQGPI